MLAAPSTPTPDEIAHSWFAHAPLVTYAVTSEYETPSPIELGPSIIFDQPTGCCFIIEKPDRLAVEAKKFIDFASHLLAIDKDAEKLADALVHKAIGHIKTRPIKKSPTK